MDGEELHRARLVTSEGLSHTAEEEGVEADLGKVSTGRLSGQGKSR